MSQPELMCTIHTPTQHCGWFTPLEYGVATALFCLVIAVGGCGAVESNDHLKKLATAHLVPAHYLISHKEQPIGTLQLSGKLTSDGGFQFQRKMRMPSSAVLMLTTDTTYTFNGRAPFSLTYAFKETFEESTDTVLERAIFDSEKLAATHPFDSVKDLPTYLVLEHWLMNPSRSDSISVSATGASLGDREDEVTTWTISEIRDNQIEIKSSTNQLATYELMEGIPILVSSKGSNGLEIRKVSEKESLSAEMQVQDYPLNLQIPVNEPIQNAYALKTLTVQLTFKDNQAGPWNQVLNDDGLLVSQTDAPLELWFDWWDEDLRPKLTSEVSRAAKSISSTRHTEMQRIESLIEYIYEYFDYEETLAPQPVIQTLRNRKGDCADFARLFTSLASALNLNSRVVTGIAYDSRTHTFQTHAWNQVLLSDGTVKSIDATWDQTTTDATHIEFPRAFQYEILESLANMTIHVIETEYEELN